MTPDPLALAVAAELERRGWSLRELARRSGVPEPKLSLWMNAKKDVTLRTLHKVAAALGREVRMGRRRRDDA